jgi:hypothetical protein
MNSWFIPVAAGQCTMDHGDIHSGTAVGQHEFGGDRINGVYNHLTR